MTVGKAKRAISFLSYRMGLTQGLVKLQSVLKPGKPNTFRVLNYHRVNDFNNPFTIDSVAATDFENQMHFISKGYHVLSLDEIYDHIANNHTLPTQCLAITFDDGYEDNYTFAYPILKKYNLPSTIFLTVDCVDTQTPLWFDQVLFAFKETSTKKFDSPLNDGVFDINTLEQKFYTAHVMLENLKKLDNDQRKKSLIDVLKELGISSNKTSHNTANLLIWPQIMEMSRHNISFGSHTMTHPILANLPDTEMEWELSTSKKTIESKIGKEVCFFAYPNGKESDYDEIVIQSVKQAGYKAAMTTAPTTNAASTDFFTWGRYKPWQNQVEHFSMALFMHGLSN